MKTIITSVVIAFGLLACGTQPKVADEPPPTTTTTTTLPPPEIREIPVGLSGAVGTTKCQVSPPPRQGAWHDDVVRWTFTVMTDQCKQKKVKIHGKGNEINCDTGEDVAVNVPLPFEQCERDDVKTGNAVNSKLRISCSVPSNVTAHKCYKYTIGGEVTNGDPEIELERPRAPTEISVPRASPPPSPSAAVR